MKADFIAFVFTLFIACAVARSPPKPGCDEDNCPGPLKIYRELGCQPVKRNPDDCCAMKYNCDHLKSRSDDKCYAFGKEYNPTEGMSEEVRGCLPTCTCLKIDDAAFWACASVHIQISTAAGCYHPRNATMCFPGPETCPPNSDDIAKCVVDGKTYEDGDYFEPEGSPKKACWCGPDYKGENIMPFCRIMKDEKCGFELGHNLEDNCAPVWHDGQNTAVECHHSWRCKHDGDKITPRETVLGVPEGETPDPEDMRCRIGDTSMRLGDELNEIASDKPHCIKCACEIPPIATCRRVPKEMCS